MKVETKYPVLDLVPMEKVVFVICFFVFSVNSSVMYGFSYFEIEISSNSTN